MSSHVLGEHLSLSSLPRLEVTAQKKMQGFFRAANTAQNCGQFQRQVVAHLHELRMLLETRKSFLQWSTDAFLQLVKLVQNTRVRWIQLESAGKRPNRPLFVMADIEITKTQVSKDRWKLRVEFRGTLPKFDGFLVPLAVVQKISKIVAGPSVLLVSLDGLLQKNHLFQSAGKDIVS